MATVLSSRPFTPGEVALASGQAPTLYGPDGKPLDPRLFTSPFDPGPLQPLATRWPDPDRPPREYQYLPGWNLIPTPRREEPQRTKAFAELRAWADLCWQVRVAIKHRKDTLAGTKWAIQPSEDSKSPELKRKFSDEIHDISTFFRKPNPHDGVAWHQWLKQMVEEIFVTDATTFFLWPRKDGSPWAYVQVDGATIKPLIDEYAHLVGYQQIIWGYPATYYPAFAEDSSQDEPKMGNLRYCVSNPRVDSVYGTSPMEEVWPLIDTAIRRQMEALSWYTDGNIPTATLEAPKEWNETQIQRFQTYIDALFSGEPAQRHKVRVLPGGANLAPVKAFAFSREEEEAIITAVAAHFAVPRALFVTQTNRATAQETGEDVQDAGRRPLEKFVADTINDWIRQDFGTEDVEFAWIHEAAGDEAKVAQALSVYVQAGILSVDEARAERGLDPMPEEEKNAQAQRDAAARAAASPFGGGPPGAGPGGPKGKQPPQPPGKQPPGKQPPGQPPAAAANGDAPPPKTKALLDALAKWRRFAMKRWEPGVVLPVFVAEELPVEVVEAVSMSLAQAQSKDDIAKIFWQAGREVVKARRARKPDPASIAKLAKLLRDYFAAQKADVLEHAAKHLGGEV